MTRFNGSRLGFLMAILVLCAGRASLGTEVRTPLFTMQPASVRQEESMQRSLYSSQPALPPTAPALQELMRSPVRPEPHPCIRIVFFDTKTHQAPDGFASMAWMARILNICPRPVPVRVTLIILDHEHFPLAQDFADATLSRHMSNDTHGAVVLPLETMQRAVRFDLQVRPR